METTISFYQACIKRLLTEYEERAPESLETELIFDDERMRYLVLRAGWIGEKRIHSPIVHIDIWNDEIVIQANNTEDLLDTELINMGVPRDKIRLGFIPPKVWDFIKQANTESRLEIA